MQSQMKMTRLNLRQRWMSPDDVKFLVAIGLRALIEECWRNRVMLVGIVKRFSIALFHSQLLWVDAVTVCWNLSV